MDEQRRTRRRRYWVLAAVLLASAYVARTSPGAADRNGRPPVAERLVAALAAPLERSAYRLTDGLRAITVATLWPRALEAEIASCQQRIGEQNRMSAALVAATDLPELGQDLQTDADLLGGLLDGSVHAPLIGRDPTGRRDLLLVGAGATAGVKRGMSVVSGADILGTVDRVNRSTSVAYATTDRQFRVVARCARSQDFLGTARGDGRGGLTLDDLPLGADVREGDVIVTGPDPAGPAPGLRLGVVDAVALRRPVERTPAGPTARAAVRLAVTVRPVFDLGELRQVRIVPGPEGS